MLRAEGARDGEWLSLGRRQCFLVEGWDASIPLAVDTQWDLEVRVLQLMEPGLGLSSSSVLSDHDALTSWPKPSR